MRDIIFSSKGLCTIRLVKIFHNSMHYFLDLLCLVLMLGQINNSIKGAICNIQEITSILQGVIARRYLLVRTHPSIKGNCICRYKSLSLSRGFKNSVLWLYFNKALIFFSMCTYISMYLFHINIHIGLQQVLTQFKVQARYISLHYSMKELFAQFKEPHYYLAYSQWLCIKLAPVFLGISFSMRLFGIELALFSHLVLFRLFVGLISINPVFLLISVCISLVLYMAGIALRPAIHIC